MADNYIVDAKTGEIKDEINQGYKLTKPSQYKSGERYRQWLNDTRNGKQEWYIKDFIKVSSQEQRLWNKELSMIEKAFLYSMQSYLSFDNDLCNDDGNQMNTEDLIYLSGLSRGTVNSVIKSLISKFIIYKGKNGRGYQYFINPWLACKGLYVGEELRSHFRDYRIRILDGKRWGDLKEFQR